MNTVTATASLIWRGTIRSELDKLKFMGELDYIESKKFMESDFHIKFKTMQCSIEFENWFEDLSKEDAGD